LGCRLLERSQPLFLFGKFPLQASDGFCLRLVLEKVKERPQKEKGTQEEQDPLGRCQGGELVLRSKGKAFQIHPPPLLINASTAEKGAY